MATRLVAVISVVCALGLGACDNSSPADAGVDAAARDAGRDAGGRDAGIFDRCAASEGDFGCNGDIPGPTAADNAYGGRCTPDDDTDNGSCTDPTSLCYAIGRDGDPDTSPTDIGICASRCVPANAALVSASTCPTGSRCYSFTEDNSIGFCFPDCLADSDCSTNTCDDFSSCAGVEEVPTDGGVTDGGVTDGGLTDGGLTDGGLTDAAVGDAGVDAAL